MKLRLVLLTIATPAQKNLDGSPLVTAREFPHFSPSHMKTFRSSAVIFSAVAVPLLFLSGCASPVNKFVAYRAPGKSVNLGIEVISHPHMPPIFELKIDGQHVMELRWTMFDYHRSATGSHKGKTVKMMGRFIPGGTFYIDVFIDSDRSANFTFP